MYVCLCTGVTDKQIRKTLSEGACTVEEVMLCTGAGTRCGSCRSSIAELVLDHEDEAEEAKSSRVRLVVVRSASTAA